MGRAYEKCFCRKNGDDLRNLSEDAEEIPRESSQNAWRPLRNSWVIPGTFSGL